MQYFHIEALNCDYKFLFEKNNWIAYSLLAHKSPNTKIHFRNHLYFFYHNVFLFQRKNAYFLIRQHDPLGAVFRANKNNTRNDKLIFHLDSTSQQKIAQQLQTVLKETLFRL
jgi:hypothetical protein